MKSIITVAFIVLCCLACRRKGGGMLLRLHYEPGTVIDIKYRNYIITDNEGADPIRNEYIRMGLTVDSMTKDSAYAFSAKFDYVRWKNGGFLAIDQFSSDKEETEMNPAERRINAIVKPVLDSTFKLAFNTRGQLIKPFSYKSGRKIPTMFSPVDWEVYQIVFPVEKVSIGDEWTNEREIPLVGGKRISTYYIENIFDSTIQIKVDGKLIVNPNNTKTFSGRYKIDGKTMQLISAKIEIEEHTFLQGKVKAVVDIQSQ
ncbi:MAG: hypothetical protein ABJA76_21375 [Mucilaginibacter sp.]